MVIRQMRTETAICTIFSGFLHFTGQININLSFKCIATQYIVSIVQKKWRETIENSWNYNVSTFVTCRGVTRDITGPRPSQGLVTPTYTDRSVWHISICTRLTDPAQWAPFYILERHTNNPTSRLNGDICIIHRKSLSHTSYGERTL